MIKKLLVLSAIILSTLGIYSFRVSAVVFQLGDIQSQETIIVEDITYNKYVISTSTADYHVIHNLELGRYSDFDIVLHDLIYGDNAQGLSTVLEIALDYEAKTGKVVYAAVNGDFFSSTSMVGYYATDNNILHFGSTTLNSIGFTYAHKTKVGDVEYGYKLNIYDSEGNLTDWVPVNQMNAALGEGEIGVYTDNLTSIVTGTNIAKLVVEDEIILNNSVNHHEGNLISNVNDFTFNDTDYTLSSDEFVIAAKGDSESYQTLINSLDNNSRIAVYPYPINDWEEMDFIMGGYQILIDRGDVLPEPLRDAETARHPRTTMAVNRDGTIGLTVVDGRMVNIPGVTLRELAGINQDLGYYTALELDGGGSSTCLLRNLETGELEVMNTPSDGYLRSVANAVLIVGDPIVDPITTTEEIVSTLPTTEMTTTSITSEYLTDATTAITTQTTTSATTETTTTTIDTNTNEGCSSCGNFSGSTTIFGLITLLGFLWFRKRY